MSIHLERLIEQSRPTAVRDGGLDFKQEGEDPAGLAFGPLTLRSTGEPVIPGGNWITWRGAERIANRWGVELFEY